MKLAVVTMLRNEADIVQTFLRHIGGLFDYAVLTDHLSIDGTRELVAGACARHPGWVMWTLDAAGYHQDQVCTLAMQHLFASTDADYVVFLDADEFIDVPNRAALEQMLGALGGPERAGLLRWKNCVPERLDPTVIQPRERILCSPRQGTHCKVVISRAFHVGNGGKLRMRTGNHGVDNESGRDMEYLELGQILHLPIRSVAHFKRKVLVGTFSSLARSNRSLNESNHWHAMAGRIADSRLKEEDIIGMAAQYGDDVADWKPTTLAMLIANGFKPRTLPAMSDDIDLNMNDLDWNDTDRLIAAIAMTWRPEDLAQAELVLDGHTLRIRSTLPQSVQSASTEDTELRHALAETRQRLLYSEKAIRDIRGSVSFRMTAPLRAAARGWRRWTSR